MTSFKNRPPLLVLSRELLDGTGETRESGGSAFINFFGVIHRLQTRLIQVKRMDCSRARTSPGRGWEGTGGQRVEGLSEVVGGVRLGIGGRIYRSAVCAAAPHESLGDGGGRGRGKRREREGRPSAVEYQPYLQRHATTAYIFLINCLSNVYVNTVC